MKKTIDATGIESSEALIKALLEYSGLPVETKDGSELVIKQFKSINKSETMQERLNNPFNSKIFKYGFSNEHYVISVPSQSDIYFPSDKWRAITIERKKNEYYIEQLSDFPSGKDITDFDPSDYMK